MSYIPKYILKRMFPKDTCLSIVKHNGEDWVKLTMTNVISPIEVPAGKLDLGNVNLPADADKLIKIQVNGLDVPVTGEKLVNDVMLIQGGKIHTWKSIFEEGSASGAMVPVGSKLALAIKKKAFPDNVLSQMKDGAEAEVAVSINIDNPTQITHKAVLNDKGAALDLNNI